MKVTKSLSFDDKLIDKTDKEAKSLGRSLSGHIAEVLRAHFEEKARKKAAMEAGLGSSKK